MPKSVRQVILMFWLLGIAIPCSAGVACPSADGRSDPKQPNVVIFFSDDQGTLDVNCYGSADLYTPTMDRLAQHGVRFTRAYAHIVCCPSRAMLMTGRYPQRGNVNMWTQGNAKSPPGRNLHLSEVTIAESLRGAGYKTALFGKWHLGAHPDFGPTKQGFDQFFGLRGGFIDNYNHFFLHQNGFHDLYEGTQEVFAKGEYFPDMMTERALKFIDQNRDQPFFMVVAFNIPHYPEQADAKFDERYRDLPMPRQSYAKIISTTDDRMGTIMKRLDQHGLTENTVVVFMSDNGHSGEDYQIKGEQHVSGFPEGHHYGANGGGGNTGKWLGQKNSFLEGGVRVPAIISYPAKLPQGVVRQQVVTAMDWMPTILELCQVPLPENRLDGQSVLPLIESESTDSRYQAMHWQWGNRWAVLAGDWKLIGEQDKLVSLGNLADPEPEAKNYLKENPAMVQRLYGFHQEWLADVNASSENRR